MIHINIFPSMTLRGKRWFFHGKDAENGEIIFQSQGYRQHASARKTAEKIRREAGAALIIDLEKGRS